MLRRNRKVEARFTFLSERSVSALCLGKVPPPLDAENHAFPLATLEHDQDYTVIYNTNPRWQRLVDEVQRKDEV